MLLVGAVGESKWLWWLWWWWWWRWGCGRTTSVQLFSSWFPRRLNSKPELWSFLHSFTHFLSGECNPISPVERIWNLFLPLAKLIHCQYWLPPCYAKWGPGSGLVLWNRKWEINLLRPTSHVLIYKSTRYTPLDNTSCLSFVRLTDTHPPVAILPKSIHSPLFRKWTKFSPHMYAATLEWWHFRPTLVHPDPIKPTI